MLCVRVSREIELLRPLARRRPGSEALLENCAWYNDTYVSMPYLTFNIWTLRRKAAAWTAILFLWMSSAGVLSHHHRHVSAGVRGGAVAGTAGSLVASDLDCSACDWNQAVQSAAPACCRVHVAAGSLCVAARRPICRTNSRRPLIASMRAPPMFLFLAS